jgi:hypothetical protein
MWKEQVDKGVAYLDKERPGWRELIDPDKLNISSLHDCILGQVYGYFYDCPLIQSALCWFDTAFDTAFDHGFYTGLDSSREEKRELEEEWIKRCHSQTKRTETAANKVGQKQ